MYFFSCFFSGYEVKQKRKRLDQDELPRKQTRVEGNEPLSNSSNISTSNVEDDSNMPKKRRREGQGIRQKKQYRSSNKGTPSSSQCNLGVRMVVFVLAEISWPPFLSVLTRNTYALLFLYNNNKSFGLWLILTYKLH